ncbi:MAG TPA: NAD(P)H-binding protein [Gemmatimonadaceae bacterium]|nr:NAD(P)H-binding protein [Gemmatimonadaceae bacterium]
MVAGATGTLGRHLVLALLRDGWRVRAISRQRARAVALGLHDVVEADLTARGAATALARACEGAALVFSCAGASLSVRDVRDRRSFARVDRDGNLALLRATHAAGAARFAYVSVCAPPSVRRSPYVAAHEAVANALAAGSLPHTVVRPTGYFAFFDEVLRAAAGGVGVVIGDGRARTNPIHEADVADACVAAVAAGAREVDVGGPVIYTRASIVQLAFEALGRAPRLARVPAAAFRAAAVAMAPLNPRLAALLDFGARISVVDAVAPATGSRDLATYFAERAAALRRQG